MTRYPKTQKARRVCAGLLVAIALSSGTAAARPFTLTVAHHRASAYMRAVLPLAPGIWEMRFHRCWWSRPALARCSYLLYARWFDGGYAYWIQWRVQVRLRHGNAIASTDQRNDWVPLNPVRPPTG